MNGHDAICTVLASKRLNVAISEAELQRAISEAFDGAGIDHDQEFCLGRESRIDFLVGDIGVEVKTRGSTAEVTRQLHRYAMRESIGSIVLVTTRSKHRVLEGELRGKRVSVVWMNSL